MTAILPAFFAASAAAGFGSGLLDPAQQAAVADIIGRGRSGGKVLAVFQMASDAGAIVGPVLAGLLADGLGYGWAFGSNRRHPAARRRRLVRGARPMRPAGNRLTEQPSVQTLKPTQRELGCERLVQQRVDEASASNGARSSGPSPRPMSFTGTPSDFWMATTIPPFAVPSSFVSTIPVMLTTSAKTVAWFRPFWPVVASRTSRTSSTSASFSMTRLTLLELVHQADLVLQAAGGVDHHYVHFLLDAGLDGFIGDRGGVRADDVRPDGCDADALAPRGELLGGRCTEGVGGAQQDVLVFGHEDARELADGGGLADAVDADDDHDGRVGSLACPRSGCGPCPGPQA